MNRYRLLAFSILLLFALASSAQQTAASSGQPAQAKSSESRVDGHLHALSEKLDLTADQQQKLRPILQQLFDGQQKLMQDTSLSADQRHEKMKQLHDSADRQARTFLTDDQKKKLDALEAEPHHDHAN